MRLPRLDGSIEDYALLGTPVAPGPAVAPTRIAYAAAHVVADPLNSPDPRRAVAIDWDATLAFRHHLWSHGMRIAEAMDTAQRGNGFGWADAKILIARVLKESRTVEGADLAAGVGTDQIAEPAGATLAEVIAAYEEQFAFVEGEGGRAIMMASRALAKAARSAEDYEAVYGRLLGQAARPVVLHWLGPMFDPALAGYWGSDDFGTALETVLRIIAANPGKVEGIKLSLLDAEKELVLRDRLPAGVAMYTGDDFNYPDLIKGDGRRHSDALLGIFDPIAPVAAAALRHLAAGDVAAYDRLMAPTLPLSRRIFEAPTQHYKAGIVFLAWLNGFQSHFTMLDCLQSARGILHYADIFRLADKAGLLAKPDLAEARMRSLLSLYGI